MSDQVILRVVSRFFIPFIIMLAFYIQAHGEHGPGGGFQAGVVLASSFIIYALIYGTSRMLQVISLRMMRIYSAIGVLIYMSVGFTAMAMGGNFLEYTALTQDAHLAIKIGVIIVELGVGLTVFSVMLLIFTLFSKSRGAQ